MGRFSFLLRMKSLMLLWRTLTAAAASSTTSPSCTTSALLASTSGVASSGLLRLVLSGALALLLAAIPVKPRDKLAVVKLGVMHLGARLHSAWPPLWTCTGLVEAL